MRSHRTFRNLRLRVGGRRGFSLIELLLAIFILGVGIISISAVFPAGIVQQRKTQDDVLGPVIAEAAMSTIRSKLTPADFGTFEEFGFFSPADFTESSWLARDFPNSWMEDGVAYTRAGDWPWLRPAMAAVPEGASPEDRAYAGDLDIFSARLTRSGFVASQLEAVTAYPTQFAWDPDWTTTEFGRQVGGSNGTFVPLEGLGGYETGNYLYGIPFNRKKFDFFDNPGKEDPMVTIAQEERFWPAGSDYDNETAAERPQYAWDCMFRRFQGQIQVAIFVYRLNVGAAVGGYSVAQDSGLPDVNLERDAFRPPMPARVDFPRGEDDRLLIAGSAYEYLDPEGQFSETGIQFDRAGVRGTDGDPNAAGQSLVLDPYFEGWQAPGQWLLDPYSRIHRVVQGRRNKRQGPVRLGRPIPTALPTPSRFNAAVQPELPADLQAETDKVTTLWFVPPSDRRGVSLTPIYVTVREL
ncbi:MAG: prepilin-type N-terminal cleavage/methylation domain-containing protein [Phycisphaera sp.]|nr:prepilin-type N-terminal cleavage/methylation domain-containing protein [Phycisphaera sp.]